MKNSLKSVSGVLEQCFGFSGELKRLTGGLSHKVYLLNKENVIVKVYSTEITKERLHAEVKALELLSTSSTVQIPKLISSISGEFRVTFNSTCLSCFQKIEGRRKYLLTECPADTSSIRSIGNYLGTLHKELHLKSPKVNGSKGSKILEISKGLPGVDSTEVEEMIQSLSQFDAPHFITHGDFQQSNLLYLGESISGIIDFEYSTYDYRINDIAGCLSNLLSANGEKIPANTMISSFVDGYEETFKESLHSIEKELLRPIIKLIWRVNLFWAESMVQSMLNQECPKATLNLLELYRAQTLRCLNN